MNAASVNPTFADTTSATEAENLTYQICGLALKIHAVSMSFSLSAVRVDGTIVSNNPVKYVDPWGLVGFSYGAAAGGTFGGLGGGGSFDAYYSHNDASPWYSGWSSGVGLSFWGGAGAGISKNEQEAMSAYWGLQASLNTTNNACQVAHGGASGSRILGGPYSLYGYKGTDYWGAGASYGDAFGKTIVTGGPSWTFFNGGIW